MKIKSQNFRAKPSRATVSIPLRNNITQIRSFLGMKWSLALFNRWVLDHKCRTIYQVNGQHSGIKCMPGCGQAACATEGTARKHPCLRYRFASHVSSEGGGWPLKVLQALRHNSRLVGGNIQSNFRFRRLPESAVFLSFYPTPSRPESLRLLNLRNEINSKRKNERLLGEPTEVEKQRQTVSY